MENKKMKLKFRYYDPFNDVAVYSKNFKCLAEFFKNYQLAVDGGNEPRLEMVIHTSKSGIEHWIECKDEN